MKALGPLSEESDQLPIIVNQQDDEYPSPQSSSDCEIHTHFGFGYKRRKDQ
jgi:hypothetical protein